MTPQTSLGFAAIEFAEEVIGMSLFPWQKWLLIHMLELLPDGSLRFRTVIVLVARQNGKSTLSIILSLFFMYVLARNLVIGTAQDLDVAEEIWQGAVDIIEETPDLLDQWEHTSKVNGKKFVQLKSGERYKVKAANRRAGRGLSGDLILLDELREHQSWDAWGAITKTTIARAFAMIVALSNAGDATSIVLRHLRKMAHLALGDPDGINAADDPESDLVEAPPDDVEGVEMDDSLGLFEWSAPPGCPIDDPDGRAQANPSLGYSITDRALLSAMKTDPEWVYRTECLCQWTDGSLEGPFPPGAWEAGLDNESQIVSDIVACVATSWNRSTTYVGFVGRREDGRFHGEIVAARAGQEWVTDWLKLRVQTVGFNLVVVQARGAPESTLIEEFEAAGLPVEPWGGADLGIGTGLMYEAVRNGLFVHLTQPVLDIAAATAVPRMLTDGAIVWDRKKSPTDAAPLIAITGGVWGVTRIPESPTPSAYEDNDLMIV